MTHSPEPEPNHVFEDRTGRRGRVVVVLLVVLTVTAALWLWSLGSRLLVEMPLPPIAAGGASTARPLDAFITLQGHDAEPCDRPRTDTLGHERLVLGYLLADDATALTGLQSRCDRLDRVLADAFLLGAPDGTVVPLWAHKNQALQDLADDLGLPGGAALTVARVTPSTRTEDLATLLSPGPALDKMIGQLTEQILNQPKPGLCLNLEAHPDLDPSVLRAALAQLLRATTRDGQAPPALCLISGPEARLWHDPDLVAMLDFVVVKAFHDRQSPFVSPAPPDWLSSSLKDLQTLIPGPKLVVALGTFAEIWQGDQGRSLRISYAEALTRGDATGAVPKFDPQSGASNLHFLDANGQVNDIWLLDAAALNNQLALLSAAQSIVIWPLGYEDPAIWSLLLADQAGSADAKGLAGPVDLSAQVLTDFAGPAVGAITPAVPGARWVQTDATGTLILSQGYDPMPLPNRVQRRGEDVPGGVVLSFDGLPDQADVEPMLDVLADAKVKAAFFADLRVLLRERDVVQDLAAAGHVIGLRQVPPLKDRPESRVAALMKLNFSQLFLVRNFGNPARLVLLRPAAGPPHFSQDAFAAEAFLLDLGLVPVRPSFDAAYGAIDPRGLVDRIEHDGEFDQTQVITLDLRNSGPDAVPWLAELVSRLAQDGFVFLPPDQATGTETAVSATGQPPESRFGDGLAFVLVNFLMNGIMVLFFVMLVISAVFAIFYLLLSLVRRPNAPIDPDYCPPVSVVIPAFNEEKVIEACVASVMRSDYPNFQVYIVDDGSTDHTSEVIQTLLADNPRLHLLREENAGKWHAANLALSEITTPIFIAADADSIFLSDTIRWLVQPFKDDRVGAVAGLVEVGNRENILTDFQHQEYMVTQNVLRRAHEFFDGILVVPGAVGAWRTKAVREGGGFSGETITEDADLTVAVHRAGYRVRFEERARSVTEVPVTARAFMRQRLRWQLGMLQVIWKHRGVIPSGQPVGFSVIDSLWFGPLSLLFALLDDILLLTVLGSLIYSLTLREALPTGSVPMLLFTSYFIITGIEILRTLAAFWFERRFEWKTLLVIPLLRFGYRQMLYLTAIRGMFRALTGHPTGWYKIDRTGTQLKSARRKSG